MSLRLKLALTVFAAGLVTALLVVATVLYAFRRFEHETAFRRGTAFLQRVVANNDALMDLHDRRPEEFQAWLRSILLFEPDAELYLIDLQGRVLASSAHAQLPRALHVAIAPVRDILAHPDMPYVMGDDPEHMDADAVIAVQPVRRDVIRAADPVAGYLYLVLHTQQMPEGRWEAVRSSFARPVLGLVVAVVGLTTALAALVIVSVTRPLKALTAEVSRLSERGIEETLAAGGGAGGPAAPAPRRTDEIGQLGRAFDMMLTTLRHQWGTLRRLDHFRREGVSNLSHDLRSPLTATVACLETLEARWASGAARPLLAPGDAMDERRLVEVALRNTRNAARLVQSLGDLAQLDEPEFRLRPEVVDVGELLDDIALRFAGKAAALGVAVASGGSAAGLQADEAEPAAASLDVELFERAIANLVDNALRHTAPGGRVDLSARAADGRIDVAVADSGQGIAEADLPHLFDRFYQSRQSVEPASGKGLGLAIVKRIAELHGGGVEVSSVLGQGTTVVLRLPAVDR